MREDRGTPLLSRMMILLTLTSAAALGACGGSDDGGGGTEPPVNRPPVASFTASPTSVAEGDNNQTVVTLDGRASSDPDGDPITFAWTVPSGTFEQGTTATSSLALVTFPGTGDYVVRLVVTDDEGLTDDATFTVELESRVNTPPVATVTANPTSVPAGDGNQTVVTIDASGSSDADGDNLTFSWDVPSGTFVNGTTPVNPIIQVTFPGNGAYTVTVTVSDGFDQATASVTITLS